MLQRKAGRKWTYGDYCAWPVDERWELIDGVAHAMVPAPLRRHQEILGDLYYLLRERLEGRPCRVYPAPFDVRLPDGAEADADITTVVQPDISVFCNTERLDERGARGAPDLVVEILSPSTSSKDSIVKRGLYERHGVPEYWIIDPETATLYQFRMAQGRYAEPRVLQAGRLESSALAGVALEVAAIFAHAKDAPGGD